LLGAGAVHHINNDTNALQQEALLFDRLVNRGEQEAFAG
jgi:hypothetical protein